MEGVVSLSLPGIFAANSPALADGHCENQDAGREGDTHPSWRQSSGRRLYVAADFVPTPLWQKSDAISATIQPACE
jgi:hypothetical protein